MQKRYRKMARKANGKVREIGEATVSLEPPLPMAEIVGGIPAAIEGLSREVGLMRIGAVMQSECERMAGEKNSKNPKAIGVYTFIRNSMKTEAQPERHSAPNLW